MNFCFLTGHSFRYYKRLAHRAKPYTISENQYNQFRVCRKCGKREQIGAVTTITTPWFDSRTLTSIGGASPVEDYTGMGKIE